MKWLRWGGVLCGLWMTSCGGAQEVQEVGEVVVPEVQKRVELELLDVYVQPEMRVGGRRVGGLSGLSYRNGVYYVVCDDGQSPRFYVMAVDTLGEKVKGVRVLEEVAVEPWEVGAYLDLESIVALEGGIVVGSEGSVRRGCVPAVVRCSYGGKVLGRYDLAEMYERYARHNGVFEAMAGDVSGESVWVMTEEPLVCDAPLWRANGEAPLRLTEYEWGKGGRALRSYVYMLSALPRKRTSDGERNGVSEMMMIDEGRWLVMERCYQAGYASCPTSVRLYLASEVEGLTDVLGWGSLQELEGVKVLKKELLVDLTSLAGSFPDGRVDNLEGMAWGPRLADGSRTIFLVSDDNFNSYGGQCTQWVWMKWVEGK